MNLVDDLKTGREIRKGPNFVWINPSSHPHSFSTDEVLIDWEVKPEKFEFECRFENNEKYGVAIPYGREKDLTTIHNLPLNKRCKVTVEVLP